MKPFPSIVELQQKITEDFKSKLNLSDDDLKRYDLIQKKLEKNSVDLQTLIREKLLSNEKIQIANIYGHSAIVQRDFTEGLDVSSTEFEITDF